MATTYVDELDKIARTPFKMVVLTLGYCSQAFGVAPCTATGASCYNTRYTCKDKTNYTHSTKDYTFTSIDAPLPLKTGERPYLKSVSSLPTEIKDSFTVAGRCIMKFVDELDSDVGIDPYISTRASVQGTFWKKLLARNPYYNDRPVKVYQGFIGLDGTCDYEQIWYGVIKSIAMGADGEVTIEAVDVLKSINDIDVPAETDCKLMVDLDTTITSMTLDKTSDLDSTGIVIIGTEIIEYSGNSTVTNVLSGCTRGAWGTTASTHKTDNKVQKCKYFSPKNPFDHLYDILTVDGGLSTDFVDTTAFASAKTWPLDDQINYSVLLTKPTKLKDLYFDLLDHVDAKSWVAENLKITCQRELANKPGRAYFSLTDDQNIVINSDSVSVDDNTRITRCALYWERGVLDEPEKPESYERINVAVDADAESSLEYGDVKSKKIWSPWIHSSAGTTEAVDQYTRNLVMRRVARHRDPDAIIELSVELKDSDIKTGEYVQLYTDLILNIDGTTLSGDKCQVIRREQSGNNYKLKLQKLSARRVAIIGPSTISSTYSDAPSADREYGYISGNNAFMANDDHGYRIF